MPKMKKIPLIGSIACGEPITAEQNIEKMVDVPENIRCDFSLTCHGDSMVDAGIHDKDVVYIRIQPEVENGEIAAVGGVILDYRSHSSLYSEGVLCMKKTMKKTAAALCIAATLLSVAAPAMAVSPAEYMSTAALEECNTATVAQVESLINQIGTVTTARRPAIVAAVNAYNELDDASKAQVSNFAVLAEAQQVLGLKDALAKLKISYDKVEDARSYVSPTEDRLSNQGKSYILPFFVNGSTNDPSMFFMVLCSGNKYVYLDTITIRAGEYKYTYTIDWTDVDRGYDGKQYWELTSFMGDDEDIQWFKNILSADEIIIRYSGDGGSIDHTVTPEERQAITDVLNAYDLFKAASPTVRAKALNN